MPISKIFLEEYFPVTVLLLGELLQFRHLIGGSLPIASVIIISMVTEKSRERFNLVK